MRYSANSFSGPWRIHRIPSVRPPTVAWDQRTGDRGGEQETRTAKATVPATDFLL